MPIIRVELLEGRSLDQKREFAAIVTREAARILNCAAETVDIVYLDVARHDWATGGTLQGDRT